MFLIVNLNDLYSVELAIELRCRGPASWFIECHVCQLRRCPGRRTINSDEAATSRDEAATSGRSCRLETLRSCHTQLHGAELI